MLTAYVRITALFDIGARDTIADKACFTRALVGSECIQTVGIFTARIERAVAAFIQVHASVGTIPNVAWRACITRSHSASASIPLVACAKERTFGVLARGMLVAVVRAFPALVDVTASLSIPTVAGFAFALKVDSQISAISVIVTIMSARRTFVKRICLACDTVAEVAVTTGARVRPVGVAASCIFAARTHAGCPALVYVRAYVAVALPPIIANATKRPLKVVASRQIRAIMLEKAVNHFFVSVLAQPVLPLKFARACGMAKVRVLDARSTTNGCKRGRIAERTFRVLLESVALVNVVASCSVCRVAGPSRSFVAFTDKRFSRVDAYGRTLTVVAPSLALIHQC